MNYLQKEEQEHKATKCPSKRNEPRYLSIKEQLVVGIIKGTFTSIPGSPEAIPRPKLKNPSSNSNASKFNLSRRRYFLMKF